MNDSHYALSKLHGYYHSSREQNQRRALDLAVEGQVIAGSSIQVYCNYLELWLLRNCKKEISAFDDVLVKLVCVVNGFFLVIPV